MANSEPFTFYF